jgi:hypothetical protein
MFHVLIDQSIAVLTRTHSERNADPSNKEPKEARIEESEQALVAGAKTVGRVRQIKPCVVKAEPGVFANIGKDYFRFLEIVLMCYSHASLAARLAASFGGGLEGRVFLRFSAENAAIWAAAKQGIGAYSTVHGFFASHCFNTASAGFPLGV